MIIQSLGAFMLIFWALNLARGFGGKKVEVIQKNPVEIEKKSMLFTSIASVCEDEESNFYVLDQILLFPGHVFAFQGKKDIADDTSSMAVFSLQSRYLGYAEIKEKLIFISQEHMYFVRIDSEANIYLTAMDYRIK